MQVLSINVHLSIMLVKHKFGKQLGWKDLSAPLYDSYRTTQVIIRNSFMLVLTKLTFIYKSRYKSLVNF